MGQINLEKLIPFEGQMTNSMSKKKSNAIRKTKEHDFTDGKWVKVEGAPGNLTKFVKNKK
jgi:hypothetical protein